MKILGLDTSTLISGIAVVDDRGVLAEARHDASAHKSDLLVAIDDVCKRAGVAPMELDAVAVGAGPGSFTGLRIGMATAKGIAFAAGKPLWAVSSLAALAFDGRYELGRHLQGNFTPGVVVAALDARKGEIYVGGYRVRLESPDVEPLGDERVLAPSALAGWVAEAFDDPHTSYVGDALDAYRDALAPLADDWLESRTPSGVAVAVLALAGARVDVVTGGAPTYIRKAEAEVMYPDGVPGALRRRDP
jgi:tRNA threonylcarbamoyladenosine biosynthesis protein TsaB